MNDLISRSALIEALKEDKKSLFSQVFCYVEPKMQFDVMNNLERLINNQPTVATPLSDCVGDCKSCWKTKLVNKPTVEPVRGEWIPVSERLPEEHDWYYITARLETTYTTDRCWWNGEEWQMYDFTKVKEYNDKIKIIAWMPLPEPYRKDVE